MAGLADKIDPRYRALVCFAAYNGLRWGEIAGLRWGRLNLLRGHVEVTETACELSGGKLVFNPYTKTNAGRRTVPLPRFLCKELAKLTGPNPDSQTLRSRRSKITRCAGPSSGSASGSLHAKPRISTP